MAHERVFEVTFGVTRREVASVSQRLFDAGAGAVEERDGPTLVVWVESRAEARRLARAAGAGEPSLRELDPSWRTEWMRHLGPVAITERIVLQPTSSSEKLGRGKRRLWFEPDQAFGVGSHPSTRLAARATERLCRERRVDSVLDVGTGTGVLALVAASWGAARVLGLDVDPTAVRAARRNARLNQLEACCTFSTRPVSKLRESFPLVVANIEVWVLAELATELARVVRPGGRLVLSGLLAERGPELLGRFERLGFSELRRADEEGWLGLVLGRAVSGA